MQVLTMPRLRTLASVFVTVSMAACGQGPATPTSPSTPTGPAGVLAGSLVTGDGTSSTASAGLAPGRFTTMKQAPGITITVVGTGLTVTTSADGSFVIEGVPAGSTITLQFSGPGVNATLTLGGTVSDGEVRHVTIRVEGTTAEVEADDDTSEPDVPDDKQEFEGEISALTPAPAAITVNGTAIQVPAGTPIHHGDTTIAFADLAVGDRVHVKAHPVGGVMTALDVNVQNGAATPGNGEGGDDDGGAEAPDHGHGDGHDDDGNGNGNGNGHGHD